MAFSKSKIKSIPIDIKDLVFGYIRDHSNKNKINVAMMIGYIILHFYFEKQDKFDSVSSCDKIQIINNTIFVKEQDHWFGLYQLNAYLSQEVKHGIHSWKFKVLDLSNMHYDWIGLINISDPRIQNKPLKTMSEFFHHGYGFHQIFNCNATS